MNNDKDITSEVEFGDIDGECLNFCRCACGRNFDSWDFILNVYRDYPKQCDCGRKLYFKYKVTIYEIVDP